MQTAKIIPIINKLPQIETDDELLGVTEAVELWPGRLITIAPGLHATVKYDQTDGQYSIRLKIFHEGLPVLKKYTFDDKNQIDMQHTCQRRINHLYTKYNPDTGRPIRTTIAVEYAPYPWRS